MITVLVKIDNGIIREFSMNGHANYADNGSDIVCSAVSAVTNLTLIGLAEKLNIDIQVESSESGYLKCEIPTDISQDKLDKSQFLLDCMIEELLDIEKEYGKYIKVINREV